MSIKEAFHKWNSISLVKRILCGLIIGIILGLIVPQATGISILGDLFVGALKGIAPILVFFLVMSALSNMAEGQRTNMKAIVVLYILGNLTAAMVAVIAHYLFPVSMTFASGTDVGDVAPPSGVTEVLTNLLMNLVDNPVNAIVNANYIGILFWAIIFGIALKKASEGTKNALENVSDATSIAVQGLGALVGYAKLIVLLVGAMAVVAFVVNPIIAFICIRKNPYPLVLTCLKESFITAFFTRSSAANIPVNMELCKKLQLDEDTYSISIPLGSTVNMAGAAIIISTMALAAATTLGIEVSFGTALIMCVLAAASAAGASGVAGGSLLLIPLACSLFNIPNDIAMQVVGVGFIIGVIQDSCETGINSSTDVLFTACAEMRDRRLHPERYVGKPEALMKVPKGEA